MLQNAYFLAKIGADTAENEQHFAEILPAARYIPAPSGAGVRHVERRHPMLVGLAKLAALSQPSPPEAAGTGGNFRGLVLGCIEAKFCK